MIYLNAECISGLGEDTFWTWFKREFNNSSFGIPSSIGKNDIILQYSTLGQSPYPERTISLLWELYPEMKSKLMSNEWDNIISTINNAAATSWKKVVSTELSTKYYSQYGDIDVLPIGINTELFCPLLNKTELRIKYNIPINSRVGFWSGTTHTMKGFDRLIQYSQQNPDIFWIIVWKEHGQHAHLDGALNYIHIPQEMIVELMNASDFYLSCGRLDPYFMVEWEAMSCNLPIIAPYGENKDFITSNNPREDILKLGWSRTTAKKMWEIYLKGLNVTW
jgi:glycosyltransferase involved in cell wall biosynthesis